MAKIIKQADKRRYDHINSIGDTIEFPVWVPLQNIGRTTEVRKATIIKINRKTVDAIDGFGRTWRVNMDEILN